MSLSGLLVVNKKTKMTSHDVVEKLRRILNFKKIGHAGTLDPNASGILLACLGKATKIAKFLTEYDKEYEAVIKLGVTTDTYDQEGKIIQIENDLKISEVEVRRAVESFKGEIWQTPPLYSAIKQKGKKLYQYARAGKQVERKKRKVIIKDVRVLEIKLPYVKLKVSCSKGTYIRSLANDIGERLGCGAHLFSLCRTRIGPFELKDALDLEAMEEIRNEDKIGNFLISVEKVLAHIPSVVVKDGFAKRIREGPNLFPSSVSSAEKEFNKDQMICIKNNQKEIIAIGKALRSSDEFLDERCKDKLFEYSRVL
ncbi:MAG: tRNA pseudouridine(55) synthase TruB [candidate division Zixibacteria bacterium]|nr:tRNA pseudouridine(55) synthase TruB [candidate division Zixibacteria bacterium]